MNSINAEQAERTHQDLSGADAVAKIREIVKKSSVCFFCTAVSTGDSNAARPMSVRTVDDHGHLWFLSAADSHLNEELGIDPAVRLYFQGSPHSDFLQLQGSAAVTRDKTKIAELWEPIIKTWFTGGVDDPRITVIEVTPSDGYYWDTKHGNFVAGVKMMVGMVVGKTLDDSIEGNIRM